MDTKSNYYLELFFYTFNFYLFEIIQIFMFVIYYLYCLHLIAHLLITNSQIIKFSPIIFCQKLFNLQNSVYFLSSLNRLLF